MICGIFDLIGLSDEKYGVCWCWYIYIYIRKPGQGRRGEREKHGGGRYSVVRPFRFIEPGRVFAFWHGKKVNFGFPPQHFRHAAGQVDDCARTSQNFYFVFLSFFSSIVFSFQHTFLNPNSSPISLLFFSSFYFRDFIKSKLYPN